MKREEVLAKVIELAAEQGCVEKSAVTPATHFINDLTFDSLQTVEFVMEVEDEFEISVPDDDIVKLQTVAEVADYVAAKVEAAATAS